MIAYFFYSSFHWFVSKKHHRSHHVTNLITVDNIYKVRQKVERQIFQNADIGCAQPSSNDGARATLGKGGENHLLERFTHNVGGKEFFLSQAGYPYRGNELHDSNLKSPALGG